MRAGPSPYKRTYLATGTFVPITPRQYLIAFEGTRTEPQYFDGIRRNADRIGINGSSIQCKPLYRSYLEEGFSHPKACLDRLETYLDEARIESLSIDTLATHATDWAVDSCIIARKGNEKYLRLLRDQIIENLEQHGYQKNQLIPKNNLDPAIGDCYRILIDLLSRRLKKQEYLRFVETIKEECTFFTRDDVACLVVDRDSGSFSESDYADILHECRERNIRFIVTNPQFEFWLLLHFSDCAKLDLQKIADNPNLVLEYLKEYVGGDPKHVDFSHYVNRIQDAIEHEKNFEENIEGLRGNIGSNVGVLIREMIDAGRSQNAS